MLVIDPNAYKEQISKLAEKHSNLTLELAGDISWSLQPLGFELNEVTAELDNAPFLTLDSVVAQADLWSLLRWQPRVQTFVLRGLNTTLEIDQQGQGNWQRILKDSPADKAEQPAAAKSDTAASDPLQFNIREVVIEDARIHFTDHRSGQSLLLDDINLTTSDSGFDHPFPLELAFRFANADIGVRASFSTRLTMDAELQRFDIADFQGSAELSGAALNHQTVQSSLATSFGVDLAQSTATLPSLNLQFANVELQASAEVTQLEQAPQFSGELSLKSFSLRQLLKTLNMPRIDSADPTVLNKLALSAGFQGSDQGITLKPLTLNLDDTHINGELDYRLSDSRLNANLQATALNADRYLPAPAEQPDSAPKNPSDNTAAAEAELLPLDTLRQIGWAVKLGLKQLVINGLTLNDLQLHTTAADGLVKLNQLNGTLYKGTLQATAQVDARSDKPQWHFKPHLTGVQTGPLLQDLAEVTLLSGAADVSADIRSQGNRVTALRKQARGTAQFGIAEGVIDGISTDAMACQGIALIHKESINTREWPRQTAFTDLQGLMKIEGNTLHNTSLKARVKGLELSGKGAVDIDSLLLDYRAGLTIAGPIHEDPACRINDKLLGLRIPVKCAGPLAAPEGDNSGSLCSFDSKAFAGTLEDLAKKEVKRKAQKKAEEKIQDMLGGEEDGEPDPRKEAIKGLLKEWGR